MFFTGSFDGVVAGWDANERRRVVSFDMTDKIYAVGMSPVSTSHALVACGTSDPRVRLCDPASGNVTHTFAGHRDAVWAVEWTRGCEWILATGGCDGDIRLWDVRRAGAFMVLDASNARDAALDPLAQAVTHAPDVPQFAGPAPPTRRNVDAVPDHLFTDAAVRCRGGGYGAGSRAAGAYRGGTYGHRAYASGGGGAGGGGWGAGFRRRPGSGRSGAGAGGGAGSGVAVRPHPTGTRAHDGRVTALKATPDGLRLVSAGTDNRVRLWDLADGKNANARFGVAPNDARKATALAVTADGRRVYHPSSDGDVLVFDVPAALARGKDKERGRERGRGKGENARGGGGGDGEDEDDDEYDEDEDDDSAALAAVAADRSGDGGASSSSRGIVRGGARGRVVVRVGGAKRPRGDSNARGVGPTPHATLRGHLAAACAVAIRHDTGEVYSGGADRHLLAWRPPPSLADRARVAANGDRDDPSAGTYRPFRAEAEHRRAAARAAVDEDDWSDDDGDATRGVDPDPGANEGVGLGYRRGVDG